MKLDTINLNGKNGSVEVLDKILTSTINKKLVEKVIYTSIGNYKGRKAKTKQKNEIIGSTAKIYAQKGTGGARHASRKAPIFVGGGVAHGPKGEKAYKKKKLNKLEKKLSLFSLITEKNQLKKLFIFNDFVEQIKKTKEMNIILNKFKLKNSLLILDKISKENIYKSIRNIPNIKVADVNHFSSFDILKYENIIFTTTSIKELEKKY